jgi:hypothetical protein
VSKFKHLFSICFILTAHSVSAETLWDNWYTETDDGVPKLYYNEKAEIVGDKAKIQVNTWIQEGQKIRSENLGASAKNTPLLEPLLYNFRTQENGAEKVIDGTVLNNGKIFSVKVSKNGQTAKPLRAEMLPKLIISSFFPFWIHNNYKKISGVQPTEFMAIVEDAVQDEIPVLKGTAYEMNADEISKKTKTRKLRITFGNVVNYWYVSPKGDAVEITVPSMKKVVVKTDRDIAEKFLSLPEPKFEKTTAPAPDSKNEKSQ